MTFERFALDHRLVRGRLSADDEARVRRGLARLLGLPAEGCPSREVRSKSAR